MKLSPRWRGTFAAAVALLLFGAPLESLTVKQLANLGYKDGIASLAVAGSGVAFVVAKDASVVDVWALAEQKKIGSWDAAAPEKWAVRRIVTSLDGGRVAVAYAGGHIRVFTLANGMAAAGDPQPFTAGPAPSGALEFSADGHWLAAAEGGESKDAPGVWLFDLTGKTPPRRMEGPGTAGGALKSAPKGLRHIAISPDGTRLAGASGDGALVVWKLASGEVERVRLLPPDLVQTVAFTPDGALLTSAKSFSVQMSFSGGNASVQVSNAHGSVLLEPPGSTAAKAVGGSRLIIESAAWHPSGQVLLYATEFSGTPPNRLLKVIDRSTLLAGGSMGKSAEAAMEPAPLYSDFEVTTDGRFALQQTTKGLLLWRVDVGGAAAAIPPPRPVGTSEEAKSAEAPRGASTGGNIRLGKPHAAMFRGQKVEYFMQEIHSINPPCDSGFARFDQLPEKALAEAKALGYAAGDYVDMFECNEGLEVLPALVLNAETVSEATVAKVETSTCGCAAGIALQIDDAAPIRLGCAESRDVPAPQQKVTASASVKVSAGTLTVKRTMNLAGGGRITVRCGR